MNICDAYHINTWHESYVKPREISQVINLNLYSLSLNFNNACIVPDKHWNLLVKRWEMVNMRIKRATTERKLSFSTLANWIIKMQSIPDVHLQTTNLFFLLSPSSNGISSHYSCVITTTMNLPRQRAAMKANPINESGSGEKRGAFKIKIRFRFSAIFSLLPGGKVFHFILASFPQTVSATRHNARRNSV